MITQLLYVSEATGFMSDAELKRIEFSATLFNALDGISGLLCFDGTRFMQLIEGKDAAIDALMDKIEQDRRHHDIQIIYRKSREFPNYGEWAMRCERIGDGGHLARDLDLLMAPTIPVELAATMRRFAGSAISGSA